MAKKTVTDVRDVARASAVIPGGPVDQERADLAVVGAIIEMLADRDGWRRQRILETVCAFYPHKLRGEPSGNGLGYMP